MARLVQEQRRSNDGPSKSLFCRNLHKLRTENIKQQRSMVAAFYGIRWGHHINGAISATEHPFVRMAYDGAVRLCEKKPKTQGSHFTRNHKVSI